MKINVTPFHFEELINKSYSLDMIFLLKLVYEKYEIKPLCENSEKIKTLYQTIIRKGLITEEDKITTAGQDLLVFLETKEPKRLPKRKTDDSVFETWWKAFPGADTFIYEGRKFIGCRGLRADKDNCRIKFDKILGEGKYTAEELTKALQYDVLKKKEMSVKTGKNNLTYIHNSLTYLIKRDYEPFIELIKNTELTEEKSSGGAVDI